MKKLNTLLLSVLLTLGLLLSQMTLFAQHPAFSQDFANLVSEDSRPGWIKVNSENNLNATDFINSLNGGLGFSEDFSFNPESKIKDKTGAINHVYQLRYKGIPVENNTWLLHEKRGSIFLAQGHELPNIADNIRTTPSIRTEEAINSILTKSDTIPYKRYAWEEAALETAIKSVRGDAQATHFPQATLVWVADQSGTTYTLAYKFEVYRVEPLSRKRYYIDVHRQTIIKEIELMTTNCFAEAAEEGDHTNHNHSTTKKVTAPTKVLADSPAMGKANYVTTNGGIVNFTSDNNGTDYTLDANNLGADNNQIVQTLSANNEYSFDNLTSIRDADNNWLDDSTAIGAHWGTEKVYDYFLTKHNRKSFDNNGAPLLSYVHYGSDYVNAFWNGVNMTYGDGDGVNWGALTSLDVIAHEIAHGVTENNGLGGLIYYGESGALNESFSDIFGVVFEFEYHPDGGDWLMGEDFDFTNNNGFRSMSNPADEGDPATYYGQNYYTGFGDNAGVHSNSGVQNFWFYLLVNGGTGTNEYSYTYNITGIGMDKAAAIAYRNLTTYMYDDAKYIDARDGAIQSAIDLYGENSAEHIATEEAWCAVGVGTTCLPSITVEKPVVNQFVINGTTTEITWTSTMTELIPFVKIEYTNDAGTNANWTLIAENEANDGTYDWFVPNIHGTTMRIRVSDDGNGGNRRVGNPLIADDSRTFNILPCAGTSTFIAPDNISLNVAATFTGDVPGDSFEWLINGVSQVTTQDFTHTFTDYGAYTVTYRVENTTFNCFNIEEVGVFILPDNVCDARSIVVNTTYNGHFNSATSQPDEPAPPGGYCSSAGYWCNNNLNSTVWYSFEAPASGLVDIRTEGIDYSNTRIALYEGIDCGLANPFTNAVLLDANDDIPSRCCNGSLISRTCLTPGNTYFIQVDESYSNSGEFTISVNELEVVSPLIEEEFANCSFPDDWRWTKGKGHYTGNYYVSDMPECFECAVGIRGYGETATSYYELPLLDFTVESPAFLFFDYAHVPKNDTVQNELRVEVTDGCGSYTTLFTQPSNEISTNATGTTSNDEIYYTNCTEVKNIQVDLASLAGMEKARIRIAAEGKWLNLLLMDKFFIGSVNDTCRALDSLVLVDIYNSTQGADWTVPWDLNQPIDTYEGVTVNRFGCVTAIDLDGSTNCLSCTENGNNLNGTIPDKIGDLAELAYLSLSQNNNLTGNIPTSIGKLTKLKELYIDWSQIGGALPDEIGDLASLTRLNIRYNQLTGTIPSTIGNLTKLTYLELNGNQLTGEIPSTLGNLSKLTYLNLGSNQLAGVTPTSLSSLTELTYLRLSYNELTSIPDLSTLTTLYNLNISGNPFAVDLPSWIGDLPNLNYLYASSNQWTGVLPSSFQNLTQLYVLNLSNNQLSGAFPDLSASTQLSSFYLYNNNFEGTIPQWIGSMPDLYSVSIRDNNFSGIIPDLSGASNLHDLEISNNRFTFASLLPNIAANEAVIAGNSNYEWQDYEYTPQQKIGVASSFLLVAGAEYTFDLDVDGAIADNNYKWFKDGAFLQDIIGSNQLTISNATTADLGVYTCEVTNTGAPDLTLYSFNYSLVETIAPNDKVCDAIAMDLDQSYTGTFSGAASELNEPNAPGGDCETSWCNTDLNGSVWYSFTPVTDTFVNVETSNANTKIALYEGIDCTAGDPFAGANLIAANDYKPNFCCDISFIKLACLTAGTTYYIQVEQHDPGQGDFNIILNSLPTCGLVCDLNLVNENVYEATCPGANDGRLDVYATSAGGHSLSYELYDGQNDLIRTRNGSGYFYDLSPDDYTVIIKSRDNATCSITTQLTLEEKVDITDPIATCLSDTVNVAFVHPASGLPWGHTFYLDEMNTVFGNKWHQLQLETLNPNLLFSNYYNVVYLEGSGVNTSVLSAFLTTNRQLIEDWVAVGNTLFINMSPENGEGVSLGFDGVMLNYGVYTDSAFVVAPIHPIFVGPNTPTVTKFRGYNFSHATFSKGALTATTLMESKDQEILLMEADWSDGKVIFGAINPVYWINQQTEIRHIRLNLLEYLKANAIPATNPAIQLSLDNTSTATINLNQVMVDARDDCSLSMEVLNQTIFNCDDLGINNIIVTATDAYTNTGVCSLDIEVMDIDNHCGADFCSGERSINMDDMPQYTYYGGSITSYGTIYKDSIVEFVAGNTIILKPGFHAAKGSEFTAGIGTCVDNIAETANETALARTINQDNKLFSNELKVRPNPFKQSTLIDFQLNKPQAIHLAVYSMEGQQLAILQEGVLPTGKHTKEFYAEGLQGGMYLIVLQTETELLTKKIIRMR